MALLVPLVQQEHLEIQVRPVQPDRQVEQDRPDLPGLLVQPEVPDLLVQQELQVQQELLV